MWTLQLTADDASGYATVLVITDAQADVQSGALQT